MVDKNTKNSITAIYSYTTFIKLQYLRLIYACTKKFNKKSG